MTTRPAAEDDDLLLDALEQEPGHDTLSSSLSPALQAELQGLRAVRRLLDDDTAFGVDSGADLPPAHLFDAILRAEVAARPDVIRQAIVAGHSPGTSPATTAAPTPAWWQRLSSWMVGGGVLTAAAAALLINVQRTPNLQDDASLVMPRAAAPAVAPPPPPPSMPADALGFAVEEAPATAATMASPGEMAEGSLGKADARLETKAQGPTPDLAKGAVAAETMADGRSGLGASGGGNGRGDVAGATFDAIGKADNSLNDSRTDDSRADDSLADDSLAEKVTVLPTMMGAAGKPSPVAKDVADRDAASAPSAEPAAPAVKTGTEIRRVFQERLAAKQEARREASAPAKAKKSTSSRSATAPSPSPPSSSAAARSRSFDELERDRQAQEANGILVTAENELSRGRFAIAVDLAQRAEAAAGGTLGLAPASTLARGFLGLKRPADAARVGSRLLGGDVADAQIVDGLLAAAQAALQIGDRPLATRLVQHALAPANIDVARRARAQALLAKIRAVPPRAAAKPSDP